MAIIDTLPRDPAGLLEAAAVDRLFVQVHVEIQRLAEEFCHGRRVRRRLRGVAGSRMTSDGVVVITADSYRSRERNREAARERLAELVRRACHTPRPRTATKPTRSSRERRLEAKTRRGRTKQMRGGFRGEE